LFRGCSLKRRYRLAKNKLLRLKYSPERI